MSEHVPMPLEWHPAYAHLVDVLLPLLDPAAPPAPIRLPVQHRATLDEPVDVTAALPVVTLDKRKCRGDAPYVGEPFCYEWYVLTDELGRSVAGEAFIVHYPRDLLFGSIR